MSNLRQHYLVNLIFTYCILPIEVSGVGTLVVEVLTWFTGVYFVLQPTVKTVVLRIRTAEHQLNLAGVQDVDIFQSFILSSLKRQFDSPGCCSGTLHR